METYMNFEHIVKYSSQITDFALNESLSNAEKLVLIAKRMKELDQELRRLNNYL